MIRSVLVRDLLKGKKRAVEVDENNLTFKSRIFFGIPLITNYIHMQCIYVYIYKSKVTTKNVRENCTISNRIHTKRNSVGAKMNFMQQSQQCNKEFTLRPKM